MDDILEGLFSEGEVRTVDRDRGKGLAGEIRLQPPPFEPVRAAALYTAARRDATTIDAGRTEKKRLAR